MKGIVGARSDFARSTSDPMVTYSHAISIEASKAPTDDRYSLDLLLKISLCGHDTASSMANLY